MERTPVTSSQIVSIGYDAPTAKLHIEFKGGSVYEYFDTTDEKVVTPELHAALIDAESVGKHFGANIKKDSRIAFRKLPKEEVIEEYAGHSAYSDDLPKVEIVAVGETDAEDMGGIGNSGFEDRPFDEVSF